jgi:hypothetical protein
MNTAQSFSGHVGPLAMKENRGVEAKNPVLLKEETHRIPEGVGHGGNLPIVWLSYPGFKSRDEGLRDVGYLRKIRLQDFA